MPLPAPSVSGNRATGRRAAVHEALIAYRRSRDQAALNLIISAYQGLARSLAGRFARRGEDLDDLNQVALVGLVKAVQRFDLSRGTELTTFATATILGELKRHLRDRTWWVRPPRRVHDLYIKAQRAIDELAQDLRRSPTLAELAQRIGASSEAVAEALEAGRLRNSSSLDAPGPSGDEGHGAGRVGEGDPGLAEVEGRLVLTPLLARLGERDRFVLNLRFVDGWSQTQIGARIGATQMQVSRMLARSLAQLRAWSEPESA